MENLIIFILSLVCFLGDNPEIILYAAIKRPKDTTNYVAPMIKEVEKNITKYLNIEKSNKDKEKICYGIFFIIWILVLLKDI